MSPRPLELLLVHGSRGWGGMEMHPLAQAEGLAARGHRVRVAVAAGSPLERAARARGVETIPFARRWYLDPRAFRALAVARGKHRTDGVVVHHPKDLWAALVAAGGRVPVVLHRHSAGAGAPRRDPLHRWASRRLTRTVAVSAYVAETTARLYGIPHARVGVVPYGISAPVAAPDAVADARAELGRSRPAVQRWVAVVAQLSRGKRQDLVLDALDLLRARMPDLGAVFVGAEASRGWRAELEDRARSLGLADRVLFAGHRDDPAAWMRAADLLVLPTDAESFGLVLLEALALGVPVIASAGGGVPEVIEDGKSGLLFPPGDATALADRIARLTQDATLRADLVDAGLARFSDRFTLDREIDALEALYCSLAPARRT